MFAEQMADAPPLLPTHDQLHGPVPVTVEAVPVVQRLVVRAVVTTVLLAVPQAPLTKEPNVPVCPPRTGQT